MSSSRSVPAVTAFLGVSLLSVVVPAGVLLWRRVFETLPREELEILRLVHASVVEKYVDERPPGELVIEAVKGMVESLDDYSRFVPAEQVEAFEGTEVEGTYQGIGVLLARDVAPITVEAPMPGGPAEAAGLRVGDRILAVDGHDLSDVEAERALEVAQELLLGPAGSRVALRVEHDDGEIVDVELQRGDVPHAKVRWAQLLDARQRIGYVHVAGFQRHVTSELDREIAWLEACADGGLQGLVLDLRFNTGGLLEEAVAMTNRFVPEGDIVLLKGRSGEIIERRTAEPTACLWPDLPLVVLVNHESASASEVFAGALQDHGRATIVGTRTFGKGVVQEIYTWRDRDFRLSLTTSRFYTPSGRSIEGRMRGRSDGEAQGGIPPDRVVTIDARAVEKLRARLYATEIPRRYRDAAAALAERLGRTLAAPPDPASDPQLEAALAAVREGALPKAR